MDLEPNPDKILRIRQHWWLYLPDLRNGSSSPSLRAVRNVSKASTENSSAILYLRPLASLAVITGLSPLSQGMKIIGNFWNHMSPMPIIKCIAIIIFLVIQDKIPNTVDLGQPVFFVARTELLIWLRQQQLRERIVFPLKEMLNWTQKRCLLK